MAFRWERVPGTLILFALAGCGGSSTGSVGPGPAPAAVATIYGPNPSSGVGELSVLATGAIASSNSISVGGLSSSGPLLQGIAVDSSGDIFVAEQLTLGTSPTGAILVFVPGTVGAAAPVRTIVGVSTLLTTPNTLAVDTAGDVYVGQAGGDLLEFAAGANGNVAPMRTLKGFPQKNTGIEGVLGMGLDDAGNLYLANLSGSANNILMFSAAQSGDVPPARSIAGSSTGMIGNTLGVWVDGAGEIFVTSESVVPVFGGILEFAAGANGNVAPIREITGSNTTMTGNHVTNPVLDSSGDIYVMVASGSTQNLVKFASDANGNAMPEAVSPSGTTINSFQIALH